MDIVNRLKNDYGIDMVVRSSGQDDMFYRQTVTLCIGLVVPVNHWISPLNTKVPIRWVDTTYAVPLRALAEDPEGCEWNTARSLYELFCKINPAYRLHRESEAIAKDWYGGFKALANHYANFSAHYESIGALINIGNQASALDRLDRVIRDDQPMFDALLPFPVDNRPLVLAYMLKSIYNREEAEEYTVPMRTPLTGNY